jgi:hypothetical protein
MSDRLTAEMEALLDQIETKVGEYEQWASARLQPPTEGSVTTLSHSHAPARSEVKAAANRLIEEFRQAASEKGWGREQATEYLQRYAQISRLTLREE